MTATLVTTTGVIYQANCPELLCPVAFTAAGPDAKESLNAVVEAHAPDCARQLAGRDPLKEPTDTETEITRVCNLLDAFGAVDSREQLRIAVGV